MFVAIVAMDEDTGRKNALHMPCIASEHKLIVYSYIHKTPTQIGEPCLVYKFAVIVLRH
jgi:hypothetical protein